MFSIKDAEVNGGTGGTIKVDLTNYLEKDEGVLKEEFQKLETVVNNKASVDHKHGIGEIKNLQEYLYQKSDVGHKHSATDVPDLTERVGEVETKIKELEGNIGDGSGNDGKVRLNTELIEQSSFPGTFDWYPSDKANTIYIWLDDNLIGNFGRKFGSDQYDVPIFSLAADLSVAGDKVDILNGNLTLSSDMDGRGKIIATNTIVGKNIKEDNEERLAALETEIANIKSGQLGEYKLKTSGSGPTDKTIPVIKDKAIEIGQYIDFHIADSDSNYDARLQFWRDNCLYVLDSNSQSTPIIAGNLKLDNESRLATLESKMNTIDIQLSALENKPAKISNLSIDQANSLEDRVLLLERVNIQQQNEINSLKETLANHAEVIKILAEKVGIEIEN